MMMTHGDRDGGTKCGQDEGGEMASQPKLKLDTDKIMIMMEDKNLTAKRRQTYIDTSTWSMDRAVIG